MKNSDGEILSHLISEKRTAFKELFDRYYMPLCLYSVQITDSYETSKDIVQEFFVSFYEKKLYRNVRESLKHYLFYSVRNASLAYLKEKKVLWLEEVEEVYNLPEEDVNEEELLRQQSVLYEKLQQLPPQGLKVFEEIIFHGKKYKEVADELGISVNSVKTQFSRALKRMRDSLNSLILFLLYKKSS